MPRELSYLSAPGQAPHHPRELTQIAFGERNQDMFLQGHQAFAEP
jgi:hypothetical protein